MVMDSVRVGLLKASWTWYIGFFFFSSRRRHTRFDCDWSSDVCSSDLVFDPPVWNENVSTRTRGPLCCTGTRRAAAGTAHTSAVQLTRSGIARRKRAERTVGSPDMAGAFEGKRGLILGVATNRPIAWAIAQAL